MGTNYIDDDYKVHTWFERDRAHVELRNETLDQTVVEFWDEDVEQAVEDGFLNLKNKTKTLDSLMEYAYDRHLISLGKRKERLMPIVGGGEKTKKTKGHLKIVKNPKLGEFMKQNQMLILVALAAAAYWWFKIRKPAVLAVNTTPLLTAGESSSMIPDYSSAIAPGSLMQTAQSVPMMAGW